MEATKYQPLAYTEYVNLIHMERTCGGMKMQSLEYIALSTVS